MPPFQPNRFISRQQRRAVSSASVRLSRSSAFGSYASDGRRSTRPRRNTQLFNTDYTMDPQYGREPGRYESTAREPSSSDYDEEGEGEEDDLESEPQVTGMPAPAPRDQPNTPVDLRDLQQLGFEDVYCSSCDEAELDHLMHEVHTRQSGQQQQHTRGPSIQTLDEDGAPGVSGHTTPVRASNVSRQQLRDAQVRNKSRARRWAGVGVSPFPSKNCIACHWETVPCKQKPEVLRMFFLFMESKFGVKNKELHCRETHLIFKQYILPCISRGPFKRPFRSWQILFHLQHHTPNAQARLIVACDLAWKHMWHVYESLYGANSAYNEVGMVDPKLARAFVQSQGHFMKMYSIKPASLNFNNPDSAFDLAQNTPMFPGALSSKHEEVQALVSLLQAGLQHDAAPATLVGSIDPPRLDP